MYACNKGLHLRIRRTDREQLCSRINSNWRRTFRPCRPLSTAYKTQSCINCYCYATYLLTISSPDINNVRSSEPLRHHLHLCRCYPDCYIYLFTGTKGYSWASAIQHLLTLTKACVQTLTHFLLLNCALAQCQHLWYNSIKTVIF